MANPIDALIPYLTGETASAGQDSFLDRLRAIVLRSEAERLVELLQQIGTGRFEITEASQLAAIIGWLTSPGERATWSLTIREPELGLLPDAIRIATLRL